MEHFIRRLRRLLEQHFPNAEIELERATPAQRVGGMLTWAGFEEMDQTERQAALWRVLREGLSEEDQGRITAILTVTPAEIAVMREG
jgi:hypothetical protein